MSEIENPIRTTLWKRIENINIGDRRTFYTLIIGMGILILLLPLAGGGYWQKILYTSYMFIGLASAWNYLSGYTGYTSFGPHMFIGIGGYALVVCTQYAGLNWYVALPLVGIISVMISLVIGYSLMRISGIYFAIGTLLIAEGLKYGVLWESDILGFLGGSSGMTTPVIDSTLVYALFGVILIASIILTYETATSNIGLRMLAVREDEEVLDVLGIYSLPYKVGPFVISGLLTGLLGGTYALSLGFVYPNTVFSIDITITLVLLAVLGGLGTVWGPVIGGLILMPIREILYLGFPNLYIIIYGLSLAAIIIFLPEGIINKLKDRGILSHSRGI